MDFLNTHFEESRTIIINHVNTNLLTTDESGKGRLRERLSNIEQRLDDNQKRCYTSNSLIDNKKRGHFDLFFNLAPPLGLEYMFDGKLYWVTPSKIKISDRKATLDFMTNSWSDKKVKRYKETIKAVLNIH